MCMGRSGSASPEAGSAPKQAAGIRLHRPQPMPTPRDASEAYMTQSFRGGSSLAGPPLPLIHSPHLTFLLNIPQRPPSHLEEMSVTQAPHYCIISRLVPAPGPHWLAVASSWNAHTLNLGRVLSFLYFRLLLNHQLLRDHPV